MKWFTKILCDPFTWLSVLLAVIATSIVAACASGPLALMAAGGRVVSSFFRWLLS